MPIDHTIGQRPGTGFTRWRKGVHSGAIEKVWWQARALHFLQENATHWYDGSLLVGIELWGFHKPCWCMREAPAEWQSMPADYRQRAEAQWRAWHEAQRWQPEPLRRAA